MADITVGYFWGVEKSNPDFLSPLGVSVVLVNTTKSKKSIDSISDDMEIIEVIYIQ